MRSILILLFLVVLSGCADTHELVRPAEGGKRIAIDREASAYVAVPPDGRYGAKVYAGSGATTAQEVGAGFAPYFKSITVGLRTEELGDALKTAKEKGFTYLLYPQILHWEDRATEWSGKRDRVEVKISVITVETGSVLDSGVITGKSKWATFGGDHPQDLLPVPIKEYAAALFK